MSKLREVNIVDAAGVFLVGEGIISILFSLDQRPVANVSRFVRILIGLGLFAYEK